MSSPEFPLDGVDWTTSQWQDFAQRDDCLDRMVPSDLRTALHAVAREARLTERATCARIARDYTRALSKGTHPRTGSVEEIGERIAQEIEIPF